MKNILKQTGFSLLEVMLAIALGMLLMLGLSKIYLSMKSSFYTQKNLARLQENARVASYLLTNGIEIAGYSGCISNRLPKGIRGYYYNSVPAYLRSKVAKNSDVIVIQSANVGIAKLTRDIKGITNYVYVQQNLLSDGEKALISDCETSQVFIAKNVTASYIRSDMTIKHHYQIADTEVAQFTETAYFIGRTTRKDSCGHFIYALYKVVNGGNKQELVPNIDAMKIEYDVNGQFVTADALHNWDLVMGVTMELTLHSGDLIKLWKLYIPLRERMV